MEANILAAEERVARAERAMADPKVVQDHARMAAACEELSEAQGAVARLYARWEELESLAGP
jgi:ATP-binding cassette subfamily F protein uup